MTLYVIRNIVTGKVYVGQTRRFPENRWRRHRKELNNRVHPNSKLQRAWNKYGENNFEFYILQTCGSEKELNEKEKQVIAAFDSVRQGYNIHEGGGSGPLSTSTKRKLSHTARRRFSRLSKKQQDEIRQRLAEVSRKMGLDAIKRRNKTLRRRYKDPVYKKKWRDSIVRPWDGFVSPEGKAMVIEDLSEFCTKHNLDRGTMTKVYYGHRNAHKGWTHPGNPLRDKR